MEEYKFESLTALYSRLYPAFNTKCNELNHDGIKIKEIDLWNYLKDTKWNNSDDLTMASLVNDILNVNINEYFNFIHNKENNDN